MHKLWHPGFLSVNTIQLHCKLSWCEANIVFGFIPKNNIHYSNQKCEISFLPSCHKDSQVVKTTVRGQEVVMWNLKVPSRLKTINFKLKYT